MEPMGIRYTYQTPVSSAAGDLGQRPAVSVCRQSWGCSGVQGLGFRGLGAQGFRGLEVQGFRGLGVQVLGFRVDFPKCPNSGIYFFLQRGPGSYYVLRYIPEGLGSSLPYTKAPGLDCRIPNPQGPKYLYSRMQGFYIRNYHYDLGTYLP